MSEASQRHRLWIALVLIVVGATCALIWIQRANQAVRGEARARFLEQYSHQQYLVAEMASNALEQLFSTFRRDLDLVVALFEGEDVTRLRAAEVKRSLKRIYGTVADTPVIELVVFDAKGTVVAMEPHDPYTVGRSYAWRDYYRWARQNKEPGRMYISPFMRLEGGLHRGDKEIIVAKGIYGPAGEFQGVVTCSVNFDTLVRSHVLPIKIGKQGRAWLVDANTKSVLVDPNGRIDGQNFDEALALKWPRLHRLLLDGAQGKSGNGWYDYEDPDDPRLQVRKLVSYHPIRLENRLWILGVATPEREVEALLSPFLKRQEAISTTLLVTILGATTLLLAFLFYWNRTLSKQVGDNSRALSETHSRLESTFDELLLTKKVAAVGHLALGLAHEIRNPLSSIQMNMQMIRKKIEPSGTLSENFSIVDGEIQRLNRLLGGVLDFARPRPLRLERVELGGIVRRLLQLLSQRLTEGGIRSEIKIQSPLHLVGDPEQIHQVLLNLVLNAVEAMERTQNERLLEVTAYSNESNAFIMVSDTGAGIPKETREQLFDPFYTTKTAGGGLGLSILQTIVLSHGGSVTAESEPGRGSTFTVSLPLAGPSAKGDQQP